LQRLLVVCFEEVVVLLEVEALLEEAVDRFEFVEAVGYLEEVEAALMLLEAVYMLP
jgi:hypothetical protein